MRIKRYTISVGYPTDPARPTPIRRQPLNLQPMGQLFLRNNSTAHWPVSRRPSWIRAARLPLWCRPSVPTR